VLRRGMPLLRRPPIPGGSIGEIGEDPVPAGVEQSQPVRRVGISGGGRRQPFLERRGVVRPLVGLCAALNSAC